MPPDASSDQEQGNSDAEFVEIDPTGRFGRYKEVLGRGAFKKVYRAFDELEGREVAWNQIKVAGLLRNSDMEPLYSEVHLLKTLKHKNIIKFYHSWVDTKHDHINFITEIFTSGTLRQYRKKHKQVDLRALKKWSRQILEGLLYLHSHDPPVIHRDLKCDNIFINGNQGEVKIGDLGLAAILHQTHLARTVIGTPEFMAPELYEEEYNELVDIYAFGMCLLELVTFDYPYAECDNAAQIYKKVTSGIKPASLGKVTDPGVKIFIEKCIAKASDRLSAKQLLGDPFLLSDGEMESIGRSLRPEISHSDDSDGRGENIRAESVIEVTVQVQKEDLNVIFLKLYLVDTSGYEHEIRFPFNLEADTSIAVATEMVEEFALADRDVSKFAEIIDSEIRSHIPGWGPKEASEDRFGKVTANPKDSEMTEDNSPVAVDSNVSATNIAFETLQSGGQYRSSLPSSLVLLNSSSQVEQSQDCEDHVNGVALSEQKTDGFWPQDSEKKKIDGMEANSSGGKEKKVMVTDLEVKKIADKLELLLVNQQKELDELKRKHEQAQSDFLNELSPDTRRKVLDISKLRIPG